MPRVKPDKFASAIQDILQDYLEEEMITVDEAVKKVAKAGAKQLRAKSKQTFGGTGKYAKGWTSTTETGRRSAQGYIYNKDLPGLPHLLENGHANRGGGRTPGREHIAVIEQQIIEQFEGELIHNL